MVRFDIGVVYVLLDKSKVMSRKFTILTFKVGFDGDF